MLLLGKLAGEEIVAPPLIEAPVTLNVELFVERLPRLSEKLKLPEPAVNESLLAISCTLDKSPICARGCGAP